MATSSAINNGLTDTLVTTDTAQTIPGVKNFSNGLQIGGNETLSVYDEGTFVPSVFVGSTECSYGTPREGKFTKIGNRVFFNLYVVITSKNSGAGAVQIRNLPFTAASVANGSYSALSLRLDNFSATDFYTTAFVDVGTANIVFTLNPTNANATSSYPTNETTLSNSATFMISGHYVTA